MNYVVKFFPEIIIKSKPVRKQMSKRLQNNLKDLLGRIDQGISVKLEWDKITIVCPVLGSDNLKEVEAVLAATPGIAYFLEVQIDSFETFDEVCEKTAAVVAGQLWGKSFVVRCKRSGKHELTSHDIERKVGGYLLEHTESAGVDLHHPEVTVNIEVREQTLYIIRRRLEGLGGFPLGEAEPVLSLISGGFDSPVASYMMMRRGMPVHFCFFNLGGRQHELGVKEVAYYLWQKYASTKRVKFVSVPFEPVVAEILEKIDNSQMGVVLKRMMLRAASQVAKSLELKALVTGEAVSQVSSQTITNLSVIDEASDMLVLRPLVANDKQDIVKIARDIGTEDFAANMPEYCGVISVRPTTRAKPDKVAHEESRFDFSVLDQAINDAVYINIDQIANEKYTTEAVETFAVPLPDASIIDVRHPDEQDKKPLQVAGQAILSIPFYKLHKQIHELDKQKHYLLYCDKGVMSRLHAAYMVEEGYKTGVYRPRQTG